MFDAEPRLEKSPHGDEDDPSLDKETSSMIILEGDWEFFADFNFKNQLGGKVGPGFYPNIDSADALGKGANDRIRSLSPFVSPVNVVIGRTKRGQSKKGRTTRK